MRKLQVLCGRRLKSPSETVTRRRNTHSNGSVQSVGQHPLRRSIPGSRSYHSHNKTIATYIHVTY